ncbi:Probable acetyl/propionyl carboxylase alpha subunit AccA2 [Mycobacteroides abscessus subsp. massiliense]|jgi:propionyl-CoA carboxylase alpha chain|uniref:Biotin-dependent 3-methylcrotonyl-coenzyme A carboxylase alpha1 subunit n=36 Tax=Mycobacteriaceae TaxID=1762 RepID=D5P4Z7_9MYCO|nr:acetyl/propionyl-CoA carboxylase [Mycobacterium intracellulare MOTT-02]AMT70746.1 acetyl-CoA carboxylase subunit alpha [Mycobacteroides immunogenum]AMU30800.1 acetyl/propionyl-CoA carboxylase subuit alpha [Mycobacteroides abscessus]ARQ64397.1 acetyl/propionyl-CoA carboxylase subunit alpha [Mycobacteroides abscessus subsp. massiliense]ASW90244.1 acetyl/propionyl-CoA carboxylase subunit alpha [Mycobacterium marseillense]AYM41855.1 ATP-grasp domain-containing protein [[Mycobacterium] chelonae 
MAMPKIRKVLVANRGEIARRVFRTCRDLGIATVAVYSDADADAWHVADADEAVHLPGSSAAETYLDIHRIIAAASLTGADAVHPGYGFLSENAGFARACAAADLVFIGPPPGAIDAMGSKLQAKKTMSDAGVPVLPGGDTTGLSAEQLAKLAADVGYPVLVKASAGGGGRGMRIVASPDELDEAVTSASREAAAAFADGTVFLERYVQRPRHVEIQIMADTHGNVVSLFERECSVQRRHQKVIEEAPSPVVDDALRARMSEAAIAAARAVGYVGAGTVEFVYDAAQDGKADSFAFLEMNTRLQVEHPVTELITGLDLVRAQLLVAMGRPLPEEMHNPRIRGHAVEARLCAEDPADDYRPCTGTLRTLDVPALAGVRVDSGFRAGSVISHYYDSLLAKVIAWAPTRDEALASLSAALAGARIHGVTTNRNLLVRVLRHDEFAGRGTDTGFLDRHDVAQLGAALPDTQSERLHAVAATVAGVAARRAVATLQATLPAGWRNNPSQPQTTTWQTQGGREVRVGYTLGSTGTCLQVDDEPLADVEVVEGSSERVVLRVDGVRRTYDVVLDGDVAHLDSVAGYSALRLAPRFVDPSTLNPPGSLTAPMPGSVIRLPVAEGETVSAGQTLVVLEAMKMEHTVASPIDGVLSALPVQVGHQVSSGDVLAVVEAVDGGEVASDATEL